LEQAEAWRGQLDGALEAIEEWRHRAEEMNARVAHLEQSIRDAAASHAEAVISLEAKLAEIRWERDRLVAELAAERSSKDGASSSADAIVRRAQAQASQIVASAEEETQRWFAAARRRIEMAEIHARASSD
jgi:cell division septum initiation protein DivIVA